MGLLDSETQAEEEGTLESRTESLYPLFLLGPERSRRSDDTAGRRTCPPTLHSVQLLLRQALETDRYLESQYSLIIVPNP